MPCISICSIILIRNPIFLCSGHPWICDHGVAPDRPLDPAVLSRIKQFSAMNKLKKMALQVSVFIFCLGGLYSFFLYRCSNGSLAFTMLDYQLMYFNWVPLSATDLPPLPKITNCYQPKAISIFSISCVCIVLMLLYSVRASISTSLLIEDLYLFYFDQVIAESLSEEEIAGLKEMFMAMDTDNSGAITYDELKEGMRKYGSTLKDTEIRDLMEAVSFFNINYHLGLTFLFWIYYETALVCRRNGPYL